MTDLVQHAVSHDQYQLAIVRAETTVSYFVQMAALASRTSFAVAGIAVAVA
jgi:hypothetical protein